MKLFRPAHLSTILVVECGFGNTLTETMRDIQDLI